MALEAGAKLGPYELLALIGSGGMGEVYRARDTRLAREIAIKVSAERFSERFEKEAHAIAALNHPNICTLHDVGTNYLVMELVEGPTLADRIAAGKMPLPETLAIARQIADALEAAHEKSIVHRDLKPANIKIKPDGAVKVLDFGLAKTAEPVPAGSNPENSPTLTLQDATRAGMILGTAGYMSPEQASGKPVDKRADIWAFGVVLWEMLTGRKMFSGETVSHTLAAVLIKDPEWQQLPAGTPASLRRLLRRCLERDLKRRLGDIGTARLELEAAAEEKLESIAAVTVPSRSRLVRVLATALAVSLLLLGGVSFLHFREAPPEQRTVRFQIPPPEKASFQSFSMSPDGRMLVFEANNQLWIRPFDSLEARPLAETEGISSGGSVAFWSPDSQFVAFARGGKLQKIAVSGGPPQVLCDITGFSGGTWNRDGVIVFGQVTSLFRVPEAGGAPVQVTQGGAGQQLYVDPEFLPDGRHFLYTAVGAAAGGKAETLGIFLGSLDGEPPVRLLADVTNVSYAAGSGDGYLMFRRGDTLMAQPFDPARRRLSGALFPAAERVGGFPAAAFSVSASGTLVYEPSGNPVTSQLVWKDRSGSTAGSFGPPGIYLDFSLSPDEKRIAFDLDQSGNRDVWVLEARGAASRLTFDPSIDNLPMWSPDGLRIVWPSLRGGTGFDLYIKSANGTGPETLLVKMGSQTGWASDWSRDGRFLLYQRSGGKTGQDLWIAPQPAEGAGGDRKPYPYLRSQFDEKEGKFSPDGKWVAYVSNESGRDEVYVQSVPLSGAKFQISTSGGTEPQWRKDGSELFYIAADQMLMAMPVKLGRTGAESFEKDVPKPLFAVSIDANSGISPRNYAVSHDGQRFLVRSTAGGTAPPLTVVLNWQAGRKK